MPMHKLNFKQLKSYFG